MTTLVSVADSAGRDSGGGLGAASSARWCCEQLEQGNILFFPQAPFELPEEDRTFLLAQRQSGAAYHKNISYRPNRDRLTGAAGQHRREQERLRAIMKTYSEKAIRLLAGLLEPYAAAWRVDFASFRPEEERGRRLRLHARNDLLHIDSFSTRPTNGDRILRVFTNINPAQSRVWLTTETFEGLIRRYLGPAGPAELRSSAAGPAGWNGFGQSFRRLARALRLPVTDPSPYDRFMLRFHHYLKEDHEFQDTCAKKQWEFPPKSTWIVFTDMVAHAVVSGQYALEQTLIVPRRALVLPDKAPASILERVVGRPMTSLSATGRV
ncbi:MAG TPA: Kdo hydroxylase family protein [Terriglobia bacterium]|nr:Kdo hydroxylase family protein [Terriglobia bacterium]